MFKNPWIHSHLKELHTMNVSALKLGIICNLISAINLTRVADKSNVIKTNLEHWDFKQIIIFYSLFLQGYWLDG